jgi:endonuclease G
MAPLLNRLVAPLLALLLAAALPAEDKPNRNVPFGLPSPAKADPAQREDYLIAREQYVLSYNAKKRIPNWVCWQLTKSDIGSASRAAFEPDPDLPSPMAKVTPRIYTNSGFDRGHMCPAKDRSSSKEDSRIAFYMTNIVPQSPNSNQRGWEKLEDYCRRLVKDDHVLYIACGPAGVGGTGKEGRKEEIGSGRVKVTVPNKIWKVVVVLPREDAKPRKNTRVISIIMPNNQGVGYDWSKYRVTAREIEKLTGLRFFPALPPELADALRDHLDKVDIPVPRTRKKKAEKE